MSSYASAIDKVRTASPQKTPSTDEERRSDLAVSRMCRCSGYAASALVYPCGSVSLWFAFRLMILFFVLRVMWNQSYRSHYDLKSRVLFSPLLVLNNADYRVWSFNLVI